AERGVDLDERAPEPAEPVGETRGERVVVGAQDVDPLPGDLDYLDRREERDEPVSENHVIRIDGTNRRRGHLVVARRELAEKSTRIADEGVGNDPTGRAGWQLQVVGEHGLSPAEVLSPAQLVVEEPPEQVRIVAARRNALGDDLSRALLELRSEPVVTA